MKTPQEINIEVHSATHVQGERIIADALAECRKETVRECVDAAHRFETSRRWMHGEDLYDAILVVVEPPVWEHKPKCPTPYRWTKESGWHFILAEGCILLARSDARFCDGCGAPRPQVTP